MAFLNFIFLFFFFFLNFYAIFAKAKGQTGAGSEGERLRSAGRQRLPPQRRSPLHAAGVRKIAGMFVWIPNQKDFILGGIVEIDDKLSNDASVFPLPALALSWTNPGFRVRIKGLRRCRRRSGTMSLLAAGLGVLGGAALPPGP